MSQRPLPNGLSRSAVGEGILAMAEARGVGKSFAAMDVAIALAGRDEKVWRQLMDAIRDEASRLAGERRVVLLRKGREIEPGAIRGIYRIALKGED